MTKNKNLFHKLKTIIGYSVATIVIVVALGISGLRLLLTTANVYHNEVEQLASGLLKQNVKIGSVDAKLTGFIPTLIFRDVEISSPKTKRRIITLSRVDVGLSFDALIFQQEITPSYFSIKGLDLNIRRKVDGVINIANVDLNAISGETNNNKLGRVLQQLFKYSDLEIQDSKITWHDEQQSQFWEFDNVNIHLRNTPNRNKFSLTSNLPKSLGEKIKIDLDLVGDIISPETWDVKGYVGSKGFNLKPLKRFFKNKNIALINGGADLKLWLEWKNKNISRLSGDVEFTDFSYLRNDAEEVSLKRVSGVFDSIRNDKDIWNVSIDKFNYRNKSSMLKDAALSVLFKHSNKNRGLFYVKTDALKLDVLSEVIVDHHFVSEKNKDKIKSLNLQGDLNNLSIVLQGNELSEFHASFEKISVNAWKRIPKLDSLSGRIDYKNNFGTASISSKNSTVGFPDLFRNNFYFTDLSADILFSNSNKGLFFDVVYSKAKNAEVLVNTTSKLFIPNDGSSPYLDMQTYISEGNASKISHYLPVGIMNESLVDWLDKGILEGKAEKSTVIFNGKLNDFPFNKDEGKFLVNVEASNAVVDYQNSWPRITNANIKGSFTGQGMKIALTNGEIGENRIYNSLAEIKSFLKPELELSVFAKGSVQDTMQYLVNTPILSNAKSTVNSMRWLGYVDTDIKIQIPLDNDNKNNISYSGSALLRDASVYMLDDKIDITEASGKVFFTDKYFSSQNLSAKILGDKAKVTVSSKDKDIYVSAVSKMEPSKQLNKFSIPGANKIIGSASFKSIMMFPGNGKKDKIKRSPRLKLTSNLVGVKSKLPGGFYKPTKRRQKFTFETIFTGNQKNIFGVDFGEKGSAIIETDHSRDEPYLNKGAISFSNKKAILPKRNVLYVDGSVKSITPNKWIKALELGKTGKAQTFLVNPVIFNLTRLKIKTLKGKAKKVQDIISPQSLPAFEGIINEFYYNKSFLGRIDFKASKKNYGYHFDEVIVSNKNMKLLSHGDWRHKSGKHNTNFDMTLISKNFGAMLTGFGYKGIIEQGVAKTIGKINWNASPTQFSFEKLDGEIQLQLENGKIVDIDAGAGRLLGLFSLAALPRKLLGDFKDTSKEGFNFDTAEGEITIESGDAYVEDFEIESPIASISISGRTGLVDKDYENTVEVIPKVGGGVAGLTALLVNLPAGIGFWILDKITGEQFNEASAKTYEMSGSWKKPVIEEITDDE